MNEKNLDKLFEDYHRNIAENEGLLDDSLYSRFLQEMNKERDKKSETITDNTSS